MKFCWQNMWSLEDPHTSPKVTQDINLLMEKIAKEIVKRKLTAIALLMLETGKPLSFLANQLLVFLDPLVSTFLSSAEYQTFTKLLEKRENVELLITVIENTELQSNANKTNNGIKAD